MGNREGKRVEGMEREGRERGRERDRKKDRWREEE